VRVPPAQIHGDDPDAGFNEAACQQDPLAPRRSAAAVRRPGIERRHETVLLPNRLWLGIEIEGVAGRRRSQDAPRLLLESVGGLDLATGVEVAAEAIKAREQIPAVAQPVHCDPFGEFKIGTLKGPTAAGSASVSKGLLATPR